MSQYVYVMKGLSKSVEGRQILKETWLSFLPGAKIGIIGHNGAGKSTLLKIMAGIDTDYDGEAWAKEGLKIGYLEQEPRLDNTKNVFDNILEGLKEKKDLIDKYNFVNEQFAVATEPEQIDDLIAQQADLQERIDAIGAWEMEREIEIAMLALNCPPKTASVDEISGGEKRRVALCRLLLERPDMLLLDEPTNHLDAASVGWLEHYLSNYPGTVVIVTHDRYFLDKVTEWILEIDRGNCVPWHTNYSKWLSEKSKKMEQEEKEESARRRELRKELEWINQSPKARQAKSKARIANYQELLSKQRDLANGTAQIIIPKGQRLGDLVIEVRNLTKNFGSKSLFKNFSFRIQPGSIVGVVGPNGAGKTTLFNMISGKEAPDAGEIVVGPTVKLGYVDQMRDILDDNKTVWEEISDGLEELEMGDCRIKSRAYCAAFNFKGGMQQSKIGQLSGGERNRVHIAKLLKSGGNFILLDEPSNDLDVDTLRALEDAILDFVGCVMIISHDRWFLDRVATHIIFFDGSGNADFFEGNYNDYCEYVLRERGHDIQNVKVKHKKL